MNKRIKLALFVVPIAAIAVGGAVYAMPDKKQPAQLSSQPTSTVLTGTTSSTDTQPVATETQTTTTTTVTPEPTPTPAPQPDWGEYPGNPGVYVVFNKAAVMSAAGIAEGDKAAAEKLLGGWMYRNKDTNDGLCGFAAKANAYGSDWQTNPVTQLKFCDQYAKQRYGGWAEALSFQQERRFW